ncbi:Rnf180 [Columba guinea]|nr:Rnf180 [Columba guinea]
MSNQAADVLRCWRCRKYIANSVCLAKCHGKEPSDTSQPSAAAQESCNVWHVDLEAVPEWVKCVIEKTANDNLNTDDEHELRGDKESYLCAVCLDVYFNPYMCYPCHHIFCEPCLRMLAKDNPASTPCPLCRTTIARVFFQTELNNSTKSFFPTEYLKLKENFQKSNSAKWPLPSCKKAFRVFEGFQRRSDTVTRRHFPHAAHRMDYMDFEDDSRGWRFDMDMVIIYIYSVNWVIGFIVFCFLCYFFFPF